MQSTYGIDLKTFGTGSASAAKVSDVDLPIWRATGKSLTATCIEVCDVAFAEGDDWFEDLLAQYPNLVGFDYEDDYVFLYFERLDLCAVDGGLGRTFIGV